MRHDANVPSHMTLFPLTLPLLFPMSLSTAISVDGSMPPPAREKVKKKEIDPQQYVTQTDIIVVRLRLSPEVTLDIDDKFTQVAPSLIGISFLLSVCA